MKVEQWIDGSVFWIFTFCAGIVTGGIVAATYQIPERQEPETVYVCEQNELLTIEGQLK